MNPPHSRKKICRLCLIKCENFKVIDRDTINDLDMLLLKMNLFVSEEPVICTNCVEVVKKCFDFKTMCLDTCNYIASFANDENNAKMDLKTVYLSKNKDVTSIPEDYDICGFCMTLVKSCFTTCLKNTDEDDMPQKVMLVKCVPELDLNIIEKLIICSPCHGSLEEYFRLVTSCSIVEEKIKEYCESQDIVNDNPLIDLTNVLQFTSRNISTNNDNIAHVIKQEKLSADQVNFDEVVEVKNENLMEKEAHQKFDSILFVSKTALTCEDDKKPNMIKTEEFCENQANEVAGKNENYLEMEDQTFVHKENTEIETDQQDLDRSQDGVAEHMLACKKPSETTMYRCASCSFEAKQKRYLKRHSLIHQPPSETTMYQCELCSFKSKYKKSISKHMQLTHENQSDSQMFQCETCSFQTKYKESLKRHSLVHKEPSEVIMYQCDSCSYQSKYKNGLEMHSLIHKDTLEVTMYQCDLCSYQTKKKFALKVHGLVHKDASEITKYRCNLCPYQAKRKEALDMHSLVHKDSSEVIMYECDCCSYKTKHKRCLKRHVLIHKDPSQLTMYQCESCPYQTKHKGDISSHLLSHKDRSEVKIYHCESCSFSTKYRNSLKKHTCVYQCDSCSFRTKEKVLWKTHSIIHKNTSANDNVMQ